jgi:hypothetical protein
MTDFVHRVVSKALAPAGSPSALRPRPDWGALPNAPSDVGVRASAEADRVEALDRSTAASAATGPTRSMSVRAPTAVAHRETVAPEPQERRLAPDARHAGGSEPLPLETVAAHDVRREVDRTDAPASKNPRADAPVAGPSPGEASPVIAPVTLTLAGNNAGHATLTPATSIVRLPSTPLAPPQERQDQMTQIGTVPARSPIVPRASMELASTANDDSWSARRRGSLPVTGRETQRDERLAVHVTIGRLEIRAPQMVAAPTRPPIRRAQTLDEYLSKRAESSR